MPCNYCNAPIYIKAEKISRSILAPLTPEQELRDKLEDMTGEIYFEIEPRFCPMCGRRLRREEKFNA